MADQPALELQQLLKESLGMPGALGAIAYVVLKGLQAGGAEPKVIASMRVLMQEHFQQMSDNDCNILCDVVYARLKQDAEKGPWY